MWQGEMNYCQHLGSLYFVLSPSANLSTVLASCSIVFLFCSILFLFPECSWLSVTCNQEV